MAGKLFITVSGGSVQTVHAPPKSELDVKILDYDNYNTPVLTDEERELFKQTEKELQQALRDGYELIY